MARILVLLCVALITLSGCVTARPEMDIALQGDTGSGRDSLYQARISQWQERLDAGQIHGLDFAGLESWRQKVEESGWTPALVREIVSDSREMTRFEMELDDHWDTPEEFVGRNFQGDCEDIAIFMLAALKSLDYPHGVKILAVRTYFEDHALLKVEMPDGGEEIFETIQPATRGIRKLVYTTIVEFDEQSILFPEQI